METRDTELLQLGTVKGGKRRAVPAEGGKGGACVACRWREVGEGRLERGREDVAAGRGRHGRMRHASRGAVRLGVEEGREDAAAGGGRQGRMWCAGGGVAPLAVEGRSRGLEGRHGMPWRRKRVRVCERDRDAGWDEE